MEYGDVIEYRPDSGEISVSTTGKIAFKDALAQVRMNVDTIQVNDYDHFEYILEEMEDNLRKGTKHSLVFSEEVTLHFF